jgi:hypothetical protein
MKLLFIKKQFSIIIKCNIIDKKLYDLYIKQSKQLLLFVELGILLSILFYI